MAIFVWNRFLRSPQSDRTQELLRRSVENHDLKGVELSLRLGAEIHTPFFNFLGMAVQNRDSEIMDMLLAHGADPNRAIEQVLASGDQQLVDRFAQLGAIPSWNEIKRLIAIGDLSTIKTLLPHIPKMPEANSEFPGCETEPQALDRLLCYAVDAPESCRAELIELLLAHMSAPSSTALDLANWSGNANVIQQFLEHGSRYGLAEMIALGKLEEVREFLLANPQAASQERVNCPGHYSDCPILALSLWHGNHAISHLLLDSGAITEGPRDRSIPVVDSENSYFASANLAGDGREFLLLLAVDKPDRDVLRRVLERSSSWYDPRNSKSESPISALLSGNGLGQSECLRLLLNAGVPLRTDFAYELEFAINGLERCNAKEYPEQLEVIRMLRDAGACQEMRNWSQGTVNQVIEARYGLRDLDELLQTKSLPRMSIPGPVNPTY